MAELLRQSHTFSAAELAIHFCVDDATLSTRLDAGVNKVLQAFYGSVAVENKRCYRYCNPLRLVDAEDQIAARCIRQRYDVIDKIVARLASFCRQLPFEI